MPDKRISVFACESQPVVVEGLRWTFGEFQEFEFVGAAVAAGDVLHAVAEQTPDVLLLDHEDGAAACLGLLTQLRHAGAATSAVLWIRRLEEPERIRALELGARGIVRKDRPIETLLECLRSAASGRLWIDEALGDRPPPDRRTPPRLTPREKQIVSLIGRGLRNSQIAQALEISPGTVKVHLMHVFEKTGATDRFDLAMRSRKLLGANGQP